MTHYYTDNSSLASEQRVIDYVFDDETFHFTSDNGVFSKDGIDYGSYLLIRCIYNRPLGDRILDLGCGYGVIGIILKRHFPNSRVDLVDVNSRATSLAIKNGIDNHVDINVYQTDDISSLSALYNTIVLNPPIRAGKRVIFGLYEKTSLCLMEGGKLYIVIQKKHGALSTIAKLEELFSKVNVLDKIKGHYLIEAIK